MTDVAKLEKQLAKLVEEEAETGKIINIVERVLAIKPSHVYALQCKAVCSITQEKFGSALEALELLRSADRRTETSPIILFQRAYCEYRMQHFVEARVILTKGRGPEAVANHVPSRNLLAQIHYNLEEYNEAAAEYRSLLDGGAYRDELERTELETNYTAALALAAKSADALNAVRNAEERTSDLLYNAACAQIEAKDYEAALTTLRQAEQLCAQQQEGPLKFRSLAEVLALPTESVAEVLGVSALGGATRSAERSFFNEVANVWVQIAFVQYALKREEEALATLRAVLLGKPSSAVVAAVASINWTAMMRSTDFFDSHRKLKAAHNTKVTTRLTSKQLLVLRYNTALLLLSMGNASGCRRLVEQLAQEHPNHELTISLQLALAMREMRKKKTKDDSMIEGYLANYESKMQGAQSSSMVKMISAQIYLEQGNLQRAIQVLSATDGAIAAHPTTIATITSWKLQLGQTKEAVEYLRAALTHSSSTKALLQWAIHFITAHNGSYREAAELLQHVRSSMADLSGDQELIALQALCLSHHDLAAARKLMQPMTGSDDAAGKASATSTTAAAVDALVRSIPSKTKLEDLGYRRVSAGDAAEEHKKGRKQRKMRRPAKHAEEGVRANPERWIPMSLRPSVKDLPERRKRELKRLRAMEQEKLRMKAAERRKAEAAAAAS